MHTLIGLLFLAGANVQTVDLDTIGDFHDGPTCESVGLASTNALPPASSATHRNAAGYACVPVESVPYGEEGEGITMMVTVTYLTHPTRIYAADRIAVGVFPDGEACNAAAPTLQNLTANMPATIRNNVDIDVTCL